MKLFNESVMVDDERVNDFRLRVSGIKPEGV
jgi:hypothetical protein